MSLRIITALFIIMNLVGCVTTRKAYNEQRGIHADDEATTSNTKGEAAKQESEPAQKGYDVEELRTEAARLNGRVEELEHEKQITTAAHEEETKKLQAKVDDLEKQLKEKEEQARGPKIPPGKTAFEAGKDAYHANQVEQSIVFFDLYLKDHDSGKDVEEAYYLRGEANFRLKEYNKAIVDFSKFPEKFQKSPLHPKALLRIAESFELTGRKEDSKAFYSDLAEKFPKTAEGKLAKKRLKKK